MDTQALELWGNMFLNAARGQRLMEDFLHLMEKEFGSVREMFDVFSKWWGVGLSLQDIPGCLNAFLKTTEDVQKAFMGGFFSLMNYPSQADYQALLKDYEDLKETSERQEEDIRRLQEALDEKLSVHGEGITAFQNLMKRQTQQFQELMANFSKIFQEPGRPEERQKDTMSSPKKKSRSRSKP